MKLVDLLHRWAGGCLVILLALLGLSGAILVHKYNWMSLPHMGDPQVQDVALLSAALDSVMTPAQVPRSIIFARSEEHTSELQSLMRISSAVFCLKTKKLTIRILS